MQPWIRRLTLKRLSYHRAAGMSFLVSICAVIYMNMFLCTFCVRLLHLAYTFPVTNSAKCVFTEDMQTYRRLHMLVSPHEFQ